MLSFWLFFRFVSGNDFFMKASLHDRHHDRVNTFIIDSQFKHTSTKNFEHIVNGWGSSYSVLCLFFKNKKALLTQRFFVNCISNNLCSIHNYNFCEVGSGATIVFAGSVVGAEHAATVSASTKPITTFFIIYPFQVLQIRLGPSIHCLSKFTTIKSAAGAALSDRSCEHPKLLSVPLQLL